MRRNLGEPPVPWIGLLPGGEESGNQFVGIKVVHAQVLGQDVGDP
jgi:hypothetical protein